MERKGKTRTLFFKAQPKPINFYQNTVTQEWIKKQEKIQGVEVGGSLPIQLLDSTPLMVFEHSCLISLKKSIIKRNAKSIDMLKPVHHQFKEKEVSKKKKKKKDTKSNPNDFTFQKCWSPLESQSQRRKLKKKREKKWLFWQSRAMQSISFLFRLFFPSTGQENNVAQPETRDSDLQLFLIFISLFNCLFKRCFVAWQRGLPWKCACCVLSE